MNDIHRICPQCGASGPMEARHCPACGYDGRAGLPVRRNNLPATLGKAALPILAGAAGLALRAGWRLIAARIAAGTSQPAVGESRPAPSQQLPAQRPRRTIRIRSAWAVGDAQGVWRQGTSEHIIELDD